jgi:hypothetical protein
MTERFETIHRTSDPIEAEMLTDLLLQSGISARVIGTRHGALIGVAQHILALRVEVPADQAREACELLDGFLARVGEDAPDQGPRPEGEEPELSAAPPPLKPILAGGVCFVLPGGGHFYARRPAAGAVVILGYLGALSTVVAIPGRERELAAMLLLAGMLAFDVIGAQLAVRAFNRGVRASLRRQLAIAVPVLVTLAVGSRLVAPFIPDLEVVDPEAPPSPDRARPPRVEELIPSWTL